MRAVAHMLHLLTWPPRPSPPPPTAVLVGMSGQLNSMGVISHFANREPRALLGRLRGAGLGLKRPPRDASPAAAPAAHGTPPTHPLPPLRSTAYPPHSTCRGGRQAGGRQPGLAPGLWPAQRRLLRAALHVRLPGALLGPGFRAGFGLMLACAERALLRLAPRVCCLQAGGVWRGRGAATAGPRSFPRAASRAPVRACCPPNSHTHPPPPCADRARGGAVLCLPGHDADHGGAARHRGAVPGIHVQPVWLHHPLWVGPGGGVLRRGCVRAWGLHGFGFRASLVMASFLQTARASAAACSASGACHCCRG